MIIGNPVAVQFFVSKEEKIAFKRACFQCDTTMSRELRRFMREYSSNPPTPSRLYHSSPFTD